MIQNKKAASVIITALAGAVSLGGITSQTAAAADAGTGNKKIVVSGAKRSPKTTVAKSTDKNAILLKGVVWQDTNGDAQLNKGERVFTNRIVRIVDRNGRHFHTMRTNRKGVYQVYLKPGQYRVVPAMSGREIITTMAASSGYVRLYRKVNNVGIPVTLPKKPEKKIITKIPGAKGVNIYAEHNTQTVRAANGRIIRDCEDLVRSWKPPHIPETGTDVFGNDIALEVRCETDKDYANVNNVDMTGAAGYALVWANNELSRLYGTKMISLNSSYTVFELVNVYQHEAWHARSTYWSESTQSEFLSLMKKKNFYEETPSLDPYDSYKSTPMESFAWSATACDTPLVDWTGGAFNQNLIPGGCKVTKNWMNRS